MEKTIYEVACWLPGEYERVFGIFRRQKYYIFKIVYRIDEDRFWFIGNGKQHITKQGLEGSLKIIDGIIERSQQEGYRTRILERDEEFIKRFSPGGRKLKGFFLEEPDEVF